MKQNFYIFSDTLIRRKQNTLCFETVKIKQNGESSEYEDEILSGIKNDLFEKSDSKIIPVESVDAIFSYGTVNFNSRLLNFLAKYSIPLHVFNYRGYYAGTFYPRDTNFAGDMIIKQVSVICDTEKRLYIAKRIIQTAAYNILANLRYYHSRGSNLREAISIIEELYDSIECVKDIPQLMGIEGNVRYFYYSCWEDIIQAPINFKKRVRNPPSDLVNSMISFGNVMMYSTCLTEIYRSKLHPGLGFLHQPGDKKNSLSFDIAEIFKPVIVDRVIFKLLNRRIIGYQDFIMKNNFCMFKEPARKSFVKEFDTKLSKTIYYDELKKHISYRSLIRKECYKLISFIENGVEYNGFRYTNY